jgi:hypothetical protein
VTGGEIGLCGAVGAGTGASARRARARLTDGLAARAGASALFAAGVDPGPVWRTAEAAARLRPSGTAAT